MIIIEFIPTSKQDSLISSLDFSAIDSILSFKMQIMVIKTAHFLYAL